MGRRIYLVSGNSILEYGGLFANKKSYIFKNERGMRMTLLERRKALGLSRKTVAEAVGCTEPNIYYYESGAYQPKTKLALALAKLYGCTVDEIMAGCTPAGKEETK